MAIQFLNTVAVDTNVLYVDTSSDRVGIGGTPTHKLYVRNDVAATSDLDPTAIKLYNNSDGGSAIEFSNGVAGNSKLSFGVEGTGGFTDETYIGFSTSLNGASATERMRITSTGNVGIGESNPIAVSSGATTLTIKGTTTTKAGALLLRSSDNSVSSYIYPDSTNGLTLGSLSNHDVRFIANGAERMRIGSAGQIGIGGANYGTSGQVLTSNGSGSAPSWQNAGAASITGL